MIIESKTGLQRRMPRHDGWSKANRARFLDVLADTCNVTAAAAAVGKKPGSARRLKQRDGEFAMLWAQAYAEGRERLEEELVACALGQVSSGDNPDGERAAPESRPFDPKLAVEVLKLQNGSRDRRSVRVARPKQGDIDALLIERLEQLSKRLGAR